MPRRVAAVIVGCSGEPRLLLGRARSRARPVLPSRRAGRGRRKDIRLAGLARVAEAVGEDLVERCRCLRRSGRRGLRVVDGQLPVAVPEVQPQLALASGMVGLDAAADRRCRRSPESGKSRDPGRGGGDGEAVAVVAAGVSWPVELHRGNAAVEPRGRLAQHQAGVRRARAELLGTGAGEKRTAVPGRHRAKRRLCRRYPGGCHRCYWSIIVLALDNKKPYPLRGTAKIQKI